MRQGKAVVAGQRSLSCGHCVAACPVGALSVASLDPDALRFVTFRADDRWLPHGEGDPAQLVRLMASRRSCRNFKETPVKRELLEDLARIGTTAPSGSNSQPWSFTILPDRPQVRALAERVAGFFNRVNALADRTWLRNGLRLLGRPELWEYARDYRQTVGEALEAWEKNGEDRLFHGATAAIIVGSRPGASTPAEDALLASQNMLLAAHALGLGSCMIGFAVVALGKDRRIRRFVGIPDGEEIHAVIALGHPDERYARTAGRKRCVLRYAAG